MAATSGFSRGVIEEEDIDIILNEYEESDPIGLSETADRSLRTEINGGTDRDGDRIEIRYDREGQAILKAKQYVGVVSLPEGPTIEIRPKAAGTNLLYLIRYAQNLDTYTAPHPTRLQEGMTFIDALAAMYESELSRVIDKGITSGYRRREDAPRHLRGRLDLNRQVQRQGTKPTRFECTFDELTKDTIENQAVLYATSVLTGLTRDKSISQALYQHQQLLRRRVTHRPVSPIELEQIQLNRLNDYYANLLRLTELVLENINIAELVVGTRSSFGLLVNMNTIFERAVERASKEALSDRQGWSAVPQDKSHSLIQGGKHSVALKPDVTLYDDRETVRLVADAKWKIGDPSNPDFYQIAAYQLAHDAPGLLIYPEQEGDIRSECRVANHHSLTLIELPTATQFDSFADFQTGVEETLREQIDIMV